MTVFADTPRWPRHGLLWGHLISDVSREELHAVAARAGLPGRAFDLDHYDWPQGREADLAAAGVVRVSDGELTRRLIASGLRVPLKDRPAARARRSAEHAAEIGLAPVPTDLVVGPIGHADPLPVEAPAGSFRLSCEEAGEPPRIEARDAAGRAAALALWDRLDALARSAGRPGFTGQVLQLAG